LREDSEQLTKLMNEREECLRPVKIRITAHDRLMSITPSISTPSNDPKAENPEVKKEEEDDDDVLEGISTEEKFLLETLELLKTHKGKDS